MVNGLFRAQAFGSTSSHRKQAAGDSALTPDGITIAVQPAVVLQVTWQVEEVMELVFCMRVPIYD